MGMFLQTIFLSGISPLPHLGEKKSMREDSKIYTQPFTAICDFKSSLEVHVGSTIQENMS